MKIRYDGIYGYFVSYDRLNELPENYSRRVDRCPICSAELSVGLVYVVSKLKVAKLLSEDYTLICCRCYKNENTTE